VSFASLDPERLLQTVRFRTAFRALPACSSSALRCIYLLDQIGDELAIDGTVRSDDGAGRRSCRGSMTNRQTSVVERRDQLKLVGLLFVMIDEERRLVCCDHLPDFFHRRD